MTTMTEGGLGVAGGSGYLDRNPDIAALGDGPDTPLVSAAHDVSAVREAARFEQALMRRAGGLHDERAGWPGSAPGSELTSGPTSGLTFEPKSRLSPGPDSGLAHALRDGLRNAATTLDRDWNAAIGLAATSMQAGRWGPADMLALQGRMLQASLQMDLASKLVQKSTQAVDQLVRIQ